MIRNRSLDYTGTLVRVIHSNKKNYREVIGKIGIVTRDSSTLAVQIDGYYNRSSCMGCYWFDEEDLEAVREEEKGEELRMLNYKNIAIVNLLEDYNNKDYGFALYDDLKPGDMVVVNAGGKNKRVLGTVKSVMTTEEYGKGVTAEVIGVVNLENFNGREAEKIRQEELKKKKIAVENELRNKIEKLRDIEFYEKMAMEFADKDPDIARLVGELKNLSVVEV